MKAVFKYAFLFVLCLVWNAGIIAQLTNVSSQFNLNVGGAEGMSGNGISTFDFNHDGLEDITFCTWGEGVRTYVQSKNGFEEINLFNDISGDIKQPLWLDFDNDGDSDFFCTIYGESCRLFRNDGDLVFMEVTGNLNLPSYSGKSFGASAGDYDNDGWLDIYISNYDFILPAATTNWLLHNHGDGTFSEVASVLGINNGYKASFQSAWTDVNNDGWLDLFVINDKYHGNNLYLNTGSSFDDASEQMNLNHQMEAMSNSWCDFDNDMDMDVYISNTIEGNKLMRNDGDVFTDMSSVASVEVNSVCWNALWLDLNHDGNTDLHVATNSPFYLANQNQQFFNNGDGTFTLDNNQGDSFSVISESKCDWNNDGYWDIIQMQQYPLGVQIFQNDGGSNHWMKFSLQGVISNRDGVGARIVYYVGDSPKCQQTFCGDGFIAQDSQYKLLSLKSEMIVDSLQVIWPSGWIDHYFNLSSDTSYVFTEGETFHASISPSVEGQICNGDQVYLYAGQHSSYIWSNGSIDEFIAAGQAGTYAVTVQNDFGFTAQASYDVEYYPTTEWQVFSQHPSCFDESNGAISITGENVVSVLWNDGSQDFVRTNLNDGLYSYTISDDYGCESSGTSELFTPDYIHVMMTQNIPCDGEPADVDFVMEGGTGQIEIIWGKVDPQNLIEGTYIIGVVDENGCTSTFDFSIQDHPPIVITPTIEPIAFENDASIALEISGGLPPYSFLWSNGNQDSIITNLSKGDYTCEIIDAAGCIDEYYGLIAEDIFVISQQDPIVFPNPFDEYIQIGNMNGCHFQLMNGCGQIVQDGYAAPMQSISTEHLPRGIFLLECNGRLFKLLKQ